MAIDFSSLKSALNGQRLVGFTNWAGASDPASMTGGSKLTTSKRGTIKKATNPKTGWSKTNASKRGVIKGLR
jgi:hypothetical protein